MAATSFTPAEKVKILRYLGWDSSPIDDESTYFSNVINNRLNLDHTDTRETAVIDEARALLDRAVTIDEQIASAPSRLKALSFSDTTLNNSELYQLRAERGKVLNELSVLLRIYPPSTYGIELG